MALKQRKTIRSIARVGIKEDVGAVFGYVAAAIMVVAFVWYGHDIWTGSARTNPLSWWMWAIETFVGLMIYADRTDSRTCFSSIRVDRIDRLRLNWSGDCHIRVLDCDTQKIGSWSVHMGISSYAYFGSVSFDPCHVGGPIRGAVLAMDALDDLVRFSDRLRMVALGWI